MELKKCGVKVKDPKNNRLICQGDPLEVFDFMQKYDFTVEIHIINFLLSRKDARILNHLEFIHIDDKSKLVISCKPQVREAIKACIGENIANIVYPLRDMGYNSFWYEIIAKDIISVT